MGDHDVGRELRKRRPTCFGEHFGKRASMLSAACIRSSPGHPEPRCDAIAGHHQGVRVVRWPPSRGQSGQMATIKGSEWSDDHHQGFRVVKFLSSYDVIVVRVIKPD